MSLDTMNVFFSLVFLQQRRVPRQKALAAAVGAGLVGGPIGLALPVIVAGPRRPGATTTSTGEPAEVVVAVPNVVGKPEDAASDAVTKSGLNPVPSVLFTTTKPAGIVLQQDPAAGEFVEADSDVKFVVPRPPEEPKTEDEKEDRILAVVEQTLAKVEEHIASTPAPKKESGKG